MDNWPILSLLTFSPLIGLLIILCIPKDKGHWLKFAGVLAAVIPFVLAVLLYISFDANGQGAQFTEQSSLVNIQLNVDNTGDERIATHRFEFLYKLGVDGLSLPLVFLTALIGLMAALAAFHIKKRWKSFYIWFLILQMGIFGVFLAQDMILFFVFFEVTLVPIFFLIGIWGNQGRDRAANHYLIYNGVGSAILLIAFLMIITTAGFQINELSATEHELIYSGDLAVVDDHIHHAEAYVNIEPDIYPGNPFYMNDSLKWVLFMMLFIAFAIKLPIFPFHTWIVRVHVEAPLPIVMIHSGVLLKIGAYGLIRFGVLLFPEQAKSWALVMAILGLINILYGALLALVQTEFKRMLAYASISHMGVVLLGIAAFNETGWTGAIVQLISHGLISALLFLCVAIWYERTETTKLNQLGGLTKVMPFTAGMFLVGGFALLGLPGLSGFVGEFLSLLGLFETLPIITMIGLLGMILSAAYVLRSVLNILHGPLPPAFAEVRDARFVEALPMIALVAFVFLIGIYPAVINEPLQQTIASMLTKIGG